MSHSPAFLDSPVRPGGAHPSPLQPHAPVLARPVCCWLRGWAGGNTTLEAGTVQSAQLIWQKAMEKGICFRWHYCNISMCFKLFKYVTCWGQVLDIQTQKAKPFQETAPQLGCWTVTATQKLLDLTLLGSASFSLQTREMSRASLSFSVPQLHYRTPLCSLKKLSSLTTSILQHCLKPYHNIPANRGNTQVHRRQYNMQISYLADPLQIHRSHMINAPHILNWLELKA